MCSEAYIPGKEYITNQGKHLTWKYAFEKQWLFYQVWGRLMYDPGTKDEVFANGFNQKYGITFGNKLVDAHKSAGKMPLKLASFYSASWDFTLYSEGFLANAPSRFKCLYGGGSTQLMCQGKPVIFSERLIPQAIAIIAGDGPNQVQSQAQTTGDKGG